jgi:predicted Zn-dependent protease
MLLADGGDWRGAVDEATQASQAAPTNPHFLDTLAYALRKGREYGRAEACLRRAAELDPANPEWQVGLAEVLAEQGKSAEVSLAMPLVDALMASTPDHSAELGRRVEGLRAGRR